MGELHSGLGWAARRTTSSTGTVTGRGSGGQRLTASPHDAAGAARSLFSPAPLQLALVVNGWVAAITTAFPGR
jgi:hypothetical protein